MIATPELIARSYLPPWQHIPTASAEPARRVTAAELVALINAELAARPDCAGLEVSAGRLLSLGIADSEAGWAASGLCLTIRSGASTRGLRELAEVVRWIDQHYALDES